MDSMKIYLNIFTIEVSQLNLLYVKMWQTHTADSDMVDFCAIFEYLQLTYSFTI
jgi:hypothetical protein